MRMSLTMIALSTGMWFAALVLMFLSVESRQMNHPTVGQQIRSEIYLVFEILGA
jgi:hypothetical protein